MFPPPPDAVATWKKLGKLVPVGAAILFLIVDERVTAIPAVAVIGVDGSAVRSGSAHVLHRVIPNRVAPFIKRQIFPPFAAGVVML